MEQGAGRAPKTGLESWKKIKISNLCRESSRESSGVLSIACHDTICAVPASLAILLQLKPSRHMQFEII
jgi:hypothetical protein